LKPEFSVSGNQVSLGLQSLKGIGEKIANQFSIPGNYESVDHFIEERGKNKTVLERLIKLSGFDHLHSNKHGLWMWYLYKYGTGKDITEMRKDITVQFEWPDEDVQKERQRQMDEYKKLYPNRKKIPAKIINWKPKIGHTKTCNVPTRDQVMDLYDDYDLQEILVFEKQFLDYYWSSPMEMFRNSGNTINEAKISGILEVVIEDLEPRTSAKGISYVILHVTDGIETAKVSVWSDAFSSSDAEIFKQGSGIKMEVNWSDKYGSFNIKNGQVMPLEKVA